MTKTFQRWAATGLGLGLLFAGTAARADDLLLQEGFDGAGVPADWLVGNFSANPASEGWFKSVSPADTFSAQAGAADSYLATSVFVGVPGADGNPAGRIDALLATPEFSMAKTTTLSFSTRTLAANAFGESLRIGAFVAGSFVDLMTINPSVAVGAFPERWTTFQVRLPAQGEGVFGRFFFEYDVKDASRSGNYIGLDSVAITSVPEPGTWLLMLGGLAAIGVQQRRRSAQRATPAHARAQ